VGAVNNLLKANGLPGVAIHNHAVPPGAPAVDLNDNVIMGNHNFVPFPPGPSPGLCQKPTIRVTQVFLTYPRRLAGAGGRRASFLNDRFIGRAMKKNVNLGGHFATKRSG
jgi:hypothetical protein